MQKFIFRAWLPKQKKMLHHDEISITEGNVYERIYDPHSGYMNSFKREDAILMLYTGVKDSSNKLIFNGDIVKNTTPFSVEVGEAVYHEGILQYKTTKWGVNHSLFKETFEYKDMGATSTITNHYEVVGNVFEHPELLSQ